MQNLTMNRKKILLAWLLVLPAVLLRAFTVLYPMLATVAYSFMDYNVIDHAKKFTGLSNFINLFKDPNIRDTVQFTVIFTVSSVILHIIFGLTLALMLNIPFKGRKFLRSVILIPWAIPGIVAAIAAQWAFNDTYGMVNDMIGRFVNGFKFEWLVSVPGSQIAVILVDVWKDTPFFAILVLAGLQSIPAELYEAAKIDGASAIKCFRKITLPYLKPHLVTLIMFFTLWRLTGFDLVYAMTQGGPGASTSLLSYRVMQEAFKNLNFGYASSISVLLLIIMLVVAGVGMSIQKRIDY